MLLNSALFVTEASTRVNVVLITLGRAVGSIAYLAVFACEWAHFAPQNNSTPSKFSVAVYVYGLPVTIFFQAVRRKTFVTVSSYIRCFHFILSLQVDCKQQQTS